MHYVVFILSHLSGKVLYNRLIVIRRYIRCFCEQEYLCHIMIPHFKFSCMRSPHITDEYKNFPIRKYVRKNTIAEIRNESEAGLCVIHYSLYHAGHISNPRYHRYGCKSNETQFAHMV